MEEKECSRNMSDTILFGGFQDCSFVDFPGHICATAFVLGCNLRCRFCHNSVLVTRTNEIYGHDVCYILNRLSELSGKITAFCLSGGEPLIYPVGRIVDFMIETKETFPLFFKLDTNGHFPEKVEYIMKTGLVDYFAVDVKDDEDGYAGLCGDNANVDRLKKTISLLNEDGVKHEYRTTVIGNYHDEKKIRGICRMIGAGQTLYLQRFVQNEGNIDSKGFKPPDDSQMEALKKTAEKEGVECFIR